jgi:hypothetical protein
VTAAIAFPRRSPQEIELAPSPSRAPIYPRPTEEV